MLEEGIRSLLNSQNPDGGWGSVNGRRSNTEATSLAVTALETIKREELSPAARRGMNWLKDHQNSDGSWPFNDSVKIPSWSTALAMLALIPTPEHHAIVIHAAHWVLLQEGRRFGWLIKLLTALSLRKRSVDLNEELVGWPWMPDTFSWVEPTSYFLIALKKLRVDLVETKVTERIRQAELMIYDRMCVDGGWNYGNSVVFGGKLWPYPDVTALALIALQDHREREANVKSFSALEQMLTRVDSGLTLAWSIICLSLYGRPVDMLRQKLAAKYVESRFLGETKSIALALLALGEGANLLRI